jgi:CelD/BcsL family acetyltransferase involved in cellulose biosynthesis
MPHRDYSPPADDNLRLRVFRDEPVFEDVLDDWGRLSDAAEPPNFFMTPHWVRTWWRHFHQGATPRIFLYHDDLGPRALFPMMLRRRRIDGLGANVLGFMTNEETTRPQWLIRGDPAPVLSQWTADLAADRGWDVLEMASLPADTTGLEVLPGLLKNHGWRWVKRSGEGALYLDVTGDFSDYWQARSRNLRRGIRSRENRLRERGGLKLEVSRPGDDPQPWLDRVFEVAAHSWKAVFGTSVADGERRRFFIDVVTEMLPLGQAQVFMASLDGQDIAYDLTFIHRGTLYDLKIDYHQGFRELGPGMLLLKRMIEAGHKDPRVQTIDFVTDPEWMRRWTDTASENLHLRVFNRTPAGRTIGWLEQNLRPLGRAAKRIIRRAGRPRSG